jgi:hypothetical protein
MRLSWMHVSSCFGKKNLSWNRKKPFIGLPTGRDTIFHFVILVFIYSYSYLIVGVIHIRFISTRLLNQKHVWTG